MKASNLLAALSFLLSYFSFGQLSFSPNPPGGFGASPLTMNKLNMASADFNGDGIADLVITSNNNQIGVLLIDDKGNPPPTPITTYTTGVGYFTTSVVTGDFDSDGLIDIVAVSNTPTGGAISRFKNVGGGVFNAVGNVTTGFTNGFNSLVAVDIDQDGDLDVVTVYEDTPQLHLAVFRNNGSFGFTIWTPSFSFGILDAEHHLAAGVFDNSTNKPELIFVNNTTDAYRIHTFNFPAPSVTANLIYSELSYSNTLFRYIAVADFDKNGTMDIALSSGGSLVVDNFIRFISGNGDGTFATSSDINCNAPPNTGVYNLLATDLDNDSDADLVAAFLNRTSVSVAIWRNVGPFSFFIDAELNVANPGAIVTGDFNVDGKPDLAVTSTSTDQNFIFLNDAPIAPPVPDGFMLNDNDGSFLRYSGVLLSRITDFTVEGWFKIEDATFPEDQYIFYNGNHPSNGFGLFLKNSAGTLVIDASGTPISTGFSITDKEWHHFALIHNKAAEWILVFDGISSGVLLAFPIAPPTDYTIFFKASTFASPTEENSMRTGGLQEFRFWNTTLDLQTIREWMNIKVNRSHPKSFLLTSHIPMDRKAIGAVFDVAYLV